MVDRHPVFTASCHLRRIAADDDVWPYCALTLWPDLFGGTTLMREWGRIGQDGAVMRRHFTDDAAAGRELDRIARSKVRSGYRPVTLQDRHAARPKARPAEVAPVGPRRLTHAQDPRPAPAGIRAATHHTMRASQVGDERHAPAATACHG